MVDFAGVENGNGTDTVSRHAAAAASQPTASKAPTIRKSNRAERVAAGGLLWGCVGVCALLLFVAGLGLVRLLQWLW